MFSCSCAHCYIYIHMNMCTHTHMHTHATCQSKVIHLSCEWLNMDLNLDSFTVNPCTELSVEITYPRYSAHISLNRYPLASCSDTTREESCGNCVIWLQCSWLQHFSGFSWSHTFAPILQFYLPLLQWRQVKPYLWLHYNLLWILSPNIEHSFSPNHRNHSKTIIKFPLQVVL